MASNTTAEGGAYTKIFTPKTQYTDDSISTFEHTFGKNYMSAGGADMTQLMTEACGTDLIKAGAKLLDIGFGVGGAAFDFATRTGCSVHGVDVNPVGLEKANATLAAMNESLSAAGKPTLDVSFQLLSATDAEFEAESFDVIYSRDTLLHLDAASKQALFAKCLTWLKPGGKMCVGDYCLGRNSNASGEPTESFQKYLTARGYHMWTVSDYGKQFENAKFCKVDSKDMAHWYCIVCQTEMDRILRNEENRNELIASQGEDSAANLEKTYRDKIQMTLRGDRSYVLVTATKPTKEDSLPYMELRQEVCDTYTKLNHTGFVLSCDGNVSAKVPGKDEYILTPTGIDIPDLHAGNMVLCDKKGEALPSESFKPTSEVHLHTLIYESRPDVGAIVHSHSVYACALACCRMPLPPAHYAVCELVCDTSHKVLPADEAVVKCSTYHTYGTWDLAQATVAALGNNYACLMANHGAIIVGKDLEEAMYFSDRLERECEIYFKCKQLGTPKPLTPEEVQSLHRRDLTYGQDASGEKEETNEDKKE